MKKILLILILLTSILSFSQTKKKTVVSKFIINHCIDKMSNNEYYFANTKIIGANKTKTKGVIITPSLGRVNDTLKVIDITIEAIGLGICNEKSTLIIMFDDESKIVLDSWNDFNCKGTNYFKIEDYDYENLSSKKIKTIRYQNGYTFDTFTFNVVGLDKIYFNRIINNYSIREINCND